LLASLAINTLRVLRIKKSDDVRHQLVFEIPMIDELRNLGSRKQPSDAD